MDVSPLQLLLPSDVKASPEKPEAGGEKSFGEILSNALGEVNNAQVKADEVTKKFLTGEIQDVHQVTIAVEQARIMMQLAVEIRNRAVEAYQELSRMQV